MHTLKSDMKNTERLKKRSDFVALNKKAKKWVSQSLIIQALKHGEELPCPAESMRVGFTVTKKVHKSAVKRNRIKRRLRAAAADVLSTHAKPGYDYVLIGRPQTATRAYETLCKDLKWCLKKMDLLR